MIEKCFRGSVVIVLVFHQNNQGSNPTYPPSKQFFVFLRFFRLESNISPYFSPFHAKFFQRGHEVNSRRRSSIEEKEKRSVFRGIIDEQRGGSGKDGGKEKRIDKEPDIEARPLDFRHQLKSTKTRSRGWRYLSLRTFRRALVFPSLLTLWSRIRYTIPPRTRINSQ